MGTVRFAKRAIIAHVGADDDAFVMYLTELARSLPDVEFVLVADTHAAAAIALKVRIAADDNVRHLQIEAELGKGAAMRAGFNATSADLVCFLSGDGVPGKNDILDCFRTLELSPRVAGALGSRFIDAKRYTGNPFRRLCSRILNLAGNALFALGVSDPQSPIKVFRRDAMLRVFEDLRLYNHGFDIELLFQARRRGLTLVEVPICWQALPVGKPAFAIGVHAMLALSLLRILYSPLSRLPLLDFVGRRYHVPVKRFYNIMVFCWRDPTNPLAGGGEVYLHEQAKCWVRDGHRVTWFAQSFPGSAYESAVDGIRVVRWGRFPLVFLLGAFWYLFRSKRDYDFIIDCMNGIPFFTPLFSTKPKVNLIYHVHSHHFRDELPPVIAQLAIFVETRLVPLIYRRTPFVTISESTKQEMLDLGMTRLPVTLIHSGVTADLCPGGKAPQPTVLYLGRIKRYKGIRKLIDAFQAVKHSIPDARLVIAGSGDDEDALREYVRERAVRDVVFAGRVDETTKVRLMQEAWVFGMPSSIEGWGIVVIEANSCATPAIAYDVQGLRDCIRDGETGFIVQDDAAFATALQSILSDDVLRERISVSAYEWSRKFSWSNTAQRTLETIRAAQPWKAVFETNRDAEWVLRALRPASHERAPGPVKQKAL
jgi:glycosyltransferase involved in cell wall biosynthesis